MSKLAQLRERRNAKSLEANALNNKYPADQRMPAAESERLEIMLTEIEAIDSEIAREDRAMKLLAEDPTVVANSLRDKNTKEPSKHGENAKALRTFLQLGLGALDPADLQAMRSRQSPDINAAMSTTTPGEGGYTVAPEYQRSLEQAMKAYSGMLEVATIVPTSTGASLPWPTADATNELGEIVGQNQAASSGDTTFGSIPIEVYRYSSKKIAIPLELLQDSFLDIEGYVQSVLAMRLGRIFNLHSTAGDGTNKPFGVVPRAVLGKTGATGQTLSVGYDDLVDLEHSVNRAYRQPGSPRVGFMLADSSVRVVRKIKDLNGRPIFIPGYEQGNPGGAPDRLMGRPIFVNDDVPAMAANAKSILFGDFSKYIVRRVMDLTLFRMMDSGFILNGQVGFVAFNRMGGNLVDVGGAVKYYANSAA